jgi:hypothetical protein
MDLSTPTGLADHAETLSEYLYEYGKYCDKRAESSEVFFDYLISACWPKLYRRFCSWRGLGLIRNFEDRVDLLNGHLELIGTPAGPKESFMDRGAGDRTLVHFLYHNEVVFNAMLPSVLDNNVVSVSVFDHLRKAVHNACQLNDLTNIYTKETALGFHYLVYCSFLLAGQALRKIKDHQAPLKLVGAERKSGYSLLVERFKSCIAAAVAPLKLLQYVLSSTVFKRHIGVWTNDGESLEELLPKWSQKRDNLDFGRKREILAKSKGSSRESPTEDDNDDDDVPEVCKSVDSSWMSMMPRCRCQVLQDSKRSLDGLELL